MQALNAAKEACLLSIIERKFAVSEREYVMHICRVLEKSLAENCGLHIDLGEGELVRPTLRKFFFARAANALPLRRAYVRAKVDRSAAAGTEAARERLRWAAIW